jgi:imidazoleglycerol phosphate synthase cyclase subunit
MSNMRVIARLDVKSDHLIKGVRFEGLRKIGLPEEAAKKYFLEGADELLLVDNVASLYGRNHLGPLLERVSRSAFIPLTAAGGIRTLGDAEEMIRLGADKVGINTASFTNHSLISSIADKFGAQAVVGSIQARRSGESWLCLTEQGRERTGVFLQDRIQELISLGVGEILVTSIDNDGVQQGFDLELSNISASSSSVPVVVGGGCGKIEDVIELMETPQLSGVAIGSALHFEKFTANQLKERIFEVNESRRIDLNSQL